MEVRDVPACVPRRGDYSKCSFNDLPIGHEMICGYRLRCRFFQKSAEEHENTRFGNMVSKPTTYAPGSSFPSQVRLLGSGVVDARAKLALQQRCTRRMIIVPVREQDCSQVVWRDPHRLQTSQEIVGIGIHADIHRNRSSFSGNEIRTGKVRRPTKTPYAMGDGDDLDAYGGLF
jgi:hypothetical protein